MGNILKKIKQNFSAKLTAVLIIFSILTLLLFAGVRFFMNKISADYLVNSYTETGVENAAVIAENFISSHISDARSVSEDELVRAWISGSENSSDDSLLSTLCKSISSGSEIDRVWLIRENDGEYISSDSIGCLRLNAQSWHDSFLVDSSGARLVILNSGVGNTEKSAAVIVPVKENDRILGFVIEEMSFDSVADYFTSFSSSDMYSIIITDENGNMVCSPFDDSTALGILNDTENYCVKLCVESNTGWRIYAASEYSSMKGFREKTFGEEMLLLICLLVIMIIVILNVVRHECRNIPQISRSIAEISAGNYNFRINASSDNEIGLIAKSVDELAEELQHKNAIIDEYMNLDTLTGVKNRVKLHEAIDDYIISRDKERPRFALVFIDIDNFRWINETLGHKYGDMVLKEFSSRLQNVFGRVYRFSSDMFVILHDVNGSTDELEAKIAELNANLEAPVSALDSELYIRCSEGAAIYPEDGQTPSALLQSAEIALSRSKERGKNRLSYYSRSLHKKITNKAAISQLLTHALDNNELYLNYQPIISTSDRSIHGFEVLVRWESEDLGFVPPSRFVEIAEETGEIVNIGMWVFETGCRFLKQINTYNKDIIMSINVSPVQLKSRDFMDNIRRVLQVTSVDPANVQIEITETSLVDFADKSTGYINEMHELGFGIALDDFGTGYSSLNYLKSFPISCLKVDKSFVDNIAGNGADYKITDSIIDLVHSMNIKTVAEGVETLAQYNSIVNLKCDYIQGFLMSKPMDEASALEFVKMYDTMYKPDNTRLIITEKQLAEERKNRSSDTVHN
ncbi:MAG: EAL domain-containing protein [Oscillospiraceae bacterium]|nr:EAL domain-containing protein [Oscillospiraceae bacterium]MDY2847906.1 EAL domain-containing protein [Oscillospiraceae bacterium]